MTIFSLRTPPALRSACARPAPRMLKLAVPALTAGVLSASAAAADAARRAEASPDESGMLLPPVEVVASPLSTPLVVVTDPKAPRQPLPASDGADYLKTIPGFTSIRSGGTNGDPVLRGMFGSRLNVLANGMPTLGACPNRMDAPTSYIAPESYDKVTVVKGPQTVLYGPGASAGTVLFERTTPRFERPGMRFDGSVVGGSFGRNDQNVDVTAGTPDFYGRVIANHAHAQDYRDGNGRTVPSLWDKWNADAALGWTPDDHTRVELTAGTGDGYARYAGRGMDGAHFRRDTFGLSFDKRHLGDVLDRIEARVYYNEADHVMDNYTLRQPDPASSMPMRMASEVRRRTVGARAAATWRFGDAFKLVTGIDAQSNRLDSRAAMGRQNYGDQPWDAQATMWNAGAFGELTWYAAETAREIGVGHVGAIRRRVDDARQDRVHRDAAIEQLGRQRLGEPGDAGLRGGIGAHAGARLRCRARADIDDAAGGALQQIRQRSLRRIQRRFHVQRVHAVPGVDIAVRDRLPHECARDVEHRVDPAELAMHGVERVHGGLRIDEIDAAEPQRGGRHVGQRVRVGRGAAADQRDAGASRAEPCRRRDAEMAEAAGDRDDFSVDMLLHRIALRD